MLFIAFNLCRTALVARDNDALRVATEGSRGREIKRLARHDVFRLVDIGNDFFDRLLGAAPEAGEL